jgi:hypothetical protein
MQLRGIALKLTKYMVVDEAARTGWPEAQMADVIELRAYVLGRNINSAED